MAGIRLSIKNPDVSREEVTNLTANSAAAASSLTVASNDDIAANDYLSLGNPGEEQTELVRVASITGNNTVTLSGTTKFAHSSGTAIFRSLYNQISLERKPSAGAYALIVEGLIDIDIDAPDGFTIVSVAAGISTDTYKWRFYNAASGTYSSYSDELAGTGLGRTSVGYLIAEVRQFAGIPDHQALSDEQIIKYFNDCHDRIEANYDRWWFLLTETTSTVTTASQYNYALPSDFARMEALLFDDTQLNYRLHFVPLPEFDQLRIDDATMPDDDTLKYYTLLPPDGDSAKGYFGVHPVPETSSLVFTVRYYKEMATLDSFGDTTPVPLPEILVNYSLSQYYKSKENFTTAETYHNQYLQGIEMLKRLQRREVGEAEFLKWRGHRGRAKLFGSREDAYSDTQRENYF